MSEKVLKDLEEAIVTGNAKGARKAAELTVEKEVPVSIAMDTLMKAMRMVDERYVRKEYFVIDVAASASAMKEAFKILEPHMKVEPAMAKGKIVIGSLKGNIQGLGKDMVAATLQSAGFQVVNLGVDVTPEEFVKVAAREKAQVIAISVSMEETIPHLTDVVDILKKKKLRNKVKVMIGGNAVSEQTCKEYGLDAYAVDAQDGLRKVRALLS